MEPITVWTKDIKKIIDQWMNDGVKAVQIYTSENEEGSINLIIDGLECGGAGCIGADDEIHILTDNEILNIP